MPPGVLVTFPFPSTTTSTARLIGATERAVAAEVAAATRVASSASAIRLLVNVPRG